MKREPLVLLGGPIERAAVANPSRFFTACATVFVLACYLLGAIFDNGVI